MEARDDDESSQPEKRQPSAASASASAAAAATAAPTNAPRETVLGNCARCGSAEKLKFCSRCQAVRYCGRECQLVDVRRGLRS